MAPTGRLCALPAALAGLGLAGPVMAADQEVPRVPPAPHSLDARQATEVFQPDPRTLAVATRDGRRFRVELGPACPGVATAPDARLLARNGVNPRRSGGNRYYRVELARSCPQLEGGGAMSLRSGLGIGLVCGNPGDMVLTGTRMAGPFGSGVASIHAGGSPLLLANGRHPGMQATATDRLQNQGAKLGCPVSAVYPVEG